MEKQTDKQSIMPTEWLEIEIISDLNTGDSTDLIVLPKNGKRSHPDLDQKKAKRSHLDLDQKNQILRFMAKNNTMTVAQIVDIYSAKWNISLTKNVVWRIKRDSKRLLDLTGKCTGRTMVTSVLYGDFLDELYKLICESLMKTTLTYETIVIIALRLQKSDKFATDSEIQKLRFSKKWWYKYRNNRGIKYKKMCGTRKFIPELDIENERARVKTVMKKYQPKTSWNFDESSIETEYNGSYSYVTKETDGHVCKGNDKKRVTTACFISAEVINTVFVVKSYSRSLLGKRQEKKLVGNNGQHVYTRRSYGAKDTNYTVYRNAEGWVTRPVFF